MSHTSDDGDTHGRQIWLQMEQTKGCVVLHVGGELDLGTREDLRHGLVTATGLASQVVVDLSAVEFCDAAGMEVLMDVRMRARETDGSVLLAAPTASVGDLLQLADLDAEFAIYPTVEEAVSVASMRSRE